MKRFFTLIELLVVIAILSMLNNSGSTVKQVTCTANMFNICPSRIFYVNNYLNMNKNSSKYINIGKQA